MGARRASRSLGVGGGLGVEIWGPSRVDLPDRRDSRAAGRRWRVEDLIARSSGGPASLSAGLVIGGATLVGEITRGGPVLVVLLVLLLGSIPMSLRATNALASNRK